VHYIPKYFQKVQIYNVSQIFKMPRTRTTSFFAKLSKIPLDRNERARAWQRKKRWKYILCLNWQTESETFLRLFIEYSNQQSKANN